MKMMPFNKEKHGRYFDGQKPIGYVRGDIGKNGNMWTSFVPLKLFETAERNALNNYTAKFIDMPCMKSVSELYEFCKGYPEAQTENKDDKEFFFFAKDGFFAYLVKVICREKDYNFYINAYTLKAN